MTTVKLCEHCGKPLGPKSIQGLCAECFMKVGLGAATGDPSADPAAPSNPPRFVPPSPQQLAPLFPQLEILELIGQGGMGAVYKARQPALDRFVALKILPPERTANDPGFAERFTREARALAKLSHPNIVAVYDFGIVPGVAPAVSPGAAPGAPVIGGSEGAPGSSKSPGGEPSSPASGRRPETPDLHYFIMEFVDGLNLRQLERARLAPREALQIIPQICDALQFAHDEGIVHRDIKPENILLDKKGRVKIADFGIAKLMRPEAPAPAFAESAGGGGGAAGGAGEGTPPSAALTDAGKVIGTPQYMAPEQIEKPQTVDHRADIYSLGVVFYEMLTGELPLGKFAPPSKKVQVDVRLDEVVLRALEHEPERRYQQASEVKTMVATISATGTGQTAAQRKEHSVKSRKSLWLALVLSVLGLGAAVAVSVLMSQHENAARLTQQGWQLLESQQRPEATAKFEEAVKLAPRDADAWNGLGWAYFNSGKAAEAEATFRKALSLDPNLPGALNGLGRAYLAQKKYKEAETWLLKAAPKAPAAWFGLAQLYILENKPAPAVEWAQKVVDSGQGGAAAAQLLHQAKRMLQAERAGEPVNQEPASTNQAPVASSSATNATAGGDGARAEKAAVAAAEKWLSLIDKRDYPASWNQASPSFRQAVPEHDWENSVKMYRQPLGDLVSRRLMSAQYTAMLPGAPAGKYVVMQFETSFTDKKNAVETVTFTLEKNGTWAASGYFIK